MAQTPVVRKYAQGDEKGIFELSRLCFGEGDYDKWMKRWVWECEENPLGNYIWVAECDGKIVSHINFIPLSLKVGERIFRSGIATHAMTHPSFRGRGLQRKLQASMDHEIVDSGIYFYYWFPLRTTLLRAPIFHRHIRGGEDFRASRMPVMMKFLDTDEIMEKLTRSKFLAKGFSIWLNPLVRFFSGFEKNSENVKLKIEEITRFDDYINDFWEEVSRNFGIIVVRNKEHLNWRYFQRPYSNFKVLLAQEDKKILGYIVFTSRGNRGFIIDLLAYPRSPFVIQSLVLKAVEQLRNEKVHRITCQMTTSNSFYGVLRANGFLPMSFLEYPFEIAICSPPNVPTEFVKNPDNWYLTTGDVDGINL